jgi:hypothetical protein
MVERCSGRPLRARSRARHGRLCVGIVQKFRVVRILLNASALAKVNRMKREQKGQRAVPKSPCVRLVARPPAVVRLRASDPASVSSWEETQGRAGSRRTMRQTCSCHFRCTMLQAWSRRCRSFSATRCTVSARRRDIPEQRFIAPKDKLTAGCTLSNNCRKGIHCGARTRHADRGRSGPRVLARYGEPVIASSFGSIPASGAVLGDPSLEPESSDDPFWQRQ